MSKAPDDVPQDFIVERAIERFIEKHVAGEQLSVDGFCESYPVDVRLKVAEGCQAYLFLADALTARPARTHLSRRWLPWAAAVLVTLGVALAASTLWPPVASPPGSGGAPASGTTMERAGTGVSGTGTTVSTPTPDAPRRTTSLAGSGRILCDSGEPLVGFRVVITTTGGESSAYTDITGVFSVSLADDDDVTRFSIPPYRPFILDEPLAFASVFEDPVVLPTPTTLTGQVTDERGREVPLAPLQLWFCRPFDFPAAEGLPPARLITADSHGRFEVDGIQGDFVMAVMGEQGPRDPMVAGHVTHASPAAEIVWAVDPPVQVSGTVYSAEGSPQGNAEITAFLPLDSCRPRPTSIEGFFFVPPRLFRGSTVVDGSFSLELPSHPYRLFVSAGAAGTQSTTLDPKQPGPLEITLSPMEGLRGTVLDTHGRPIGGTAVRYGTPEPMGRLSTTTDAEGRFEFPHLPKPEEGMLFFHAPDYAIVGLSLRTAQAHPVIVLSEGDSVEGRVVAPDGSALAGYSVTIEGDRAIDYGFEVSPRPTWERLLGISQTLSDVEGRFAFSDLYSGEFWLRVAHPDEPELFLETRVRAGDPPVRLNFDALALEGVVLRFEVHDATTRQRLADYDLRVTPAAASRRPVREAQVRDTSEPTVLKGLPPGRIHILVASPGYAVWHETVRFPDPGDRELPVDLEPGRVGQFRVLDSSGRPVSNAQVRILDANTRTRLFFETAPHSYTTSTHTSNEGETVVQGLPRTAMILQVVRPGSATPFETPVPVAPRSGWTRITVP